MIKYKISLAVLGSMAFVNLLSAQSKLFHLTVSAPESKNTKVTVTSPVNDYYFEGNVSSFDLDAQDHQADTTWAIAGQQVICVRNDYREAKLIVNPGDRIAVEFVGRGGLAITGSSAEGQMLYNRLAEDDTRSRFEELDTAPTVEKRLQLIDSLQQVDLHEIDALKKEGKITTAFADRMKQEAAMYYKLLWSTDLFFTCRPLIFGPEEDAKKIDPSFTDAWRELYDDISTDWLASPFFPALLSRYASLLSIGDSSRNDRSQPYALKQMAQLKPHLQDELLEYAWAATILQGLGNNENEKVWITNFEEFKDAFPQSQLTAFLAPEIKKVEQYHAKLSQETAGVEWFDKAASYEGLAGLLQQLKGKYYYVDLWATWCGPCKAELQHSIALHDQLEEIGFTPLYLSIDVDGAAEKWEEMVKGYPLKGLNVRANESLRKTLGDDVPQFTGIPRYLIVDDKGEVVNWDAKRPSDGTDLIEQLRSYRGKQ